METCLYNYPAGGTGCPLFYSFVQPRFKTSSSPGVQICLYNNPAGGTGCFLLQFQQPWYQNLSIYLPSIWHRVSLILQFCAAQIQNFKTALVFKQEVKGVSFFTVLTNPDIKLVSIITRQVVQSVPYFAVLWSPNSKIRNSPGFQICLYKYPAGGTGFVLFYTFEQPWYQNLSL